MNVPDFFNDWVMQTEDFTETSVPWAGSQQQKEAILQEIGSFAVQFALARMSRKERLAGQIGALKIRLQIEVEDP